MANDGTIKIGIELDDSGVKSQAQTEGKKAGEQFADAFDDSAKSAGDSAKKSIKNAGDSAGSVGKSAGKSFADGFDSGAKGLGSKAKSEIKGAADGAKAAGTSGGESFSSGFLSAAKGISAGVTALIGAGVGKAISEAEERVGRMANLQVAATDSGTNIDDATAAYKRLYGQLGEVDRSVETTNNLLGFADGNMELLKESTDAVVGAFARWPDSVSIEGLAESMNESARTATIVGSTADVLNWAARSAEEWSASLSGNVEAQTAFNDAIEQGATVEDAFNAALAAAGDETDRAAILADALSDAYGELGRQYEELNKPLSDYRNAQDDLNQAFSDAGEALMPFATMMLGTFTPAIQGAADVIGEFAPAVQDAFSSGNFAAAGQGIGNMVSDLAGMIVEAVPEFVSAGVELAGGIAVGIVEGLPDLIVSVVDAVTQAIPQLIESAFTVVQAIVESLPQIIQAIVDAIPQIVQMIADALPNSIEALVNGFVQLFLAFVQAIPQIIEAITPHIPTLVQALATAIIENLPTILQAAIQLFMAIASAIIQATPDILANLGALLMEIIGKLPEFANQMAEGAKRAAQDFADGLINDLKSLPGKVAAKGAEIAQSLMDSIWNGIQSIPGMVTSFLGNTIGSILPFSIEAPSESYALSEGDYAATMSANSTGVMPAAMPLSAAGAPSLLADTSFGSSQVAAAVSGGRRAGVLTTIINNETTNNEFRLSVDGMSRTTQEEFSDNLFSLMDLMIREGAM